MRHTFRFFAALLLLLVGSCKDSASQTGASDSAKPITLRFIHDTAGKALAINEAVANEWAAQTGVRVEFVAAPNDTNERLTQYLNLLGAKSDTVDLYMTDVIWAGVLGEHLADLSDAFADERDAHFPAVLRNNTHDGRLVLAPYYTDAPMLYYRSDLLEKYGIAKPPATWEELEAQASTIMDGERAAGNAAFWGYVFQGRAYEGFTCNLLEWQASEGDGAIVAEDRKATVAGAGLAKRIDAAKRWLGTIAPPGAANYAEEEARGVWHSGNAAFMRNWPYAYGTSAADDSPVRGKFGVAPLPAGTKSRAHTLGGQMVAVSKYSKHRAEAIAFAKHLASAGVQKRRALEGGYLATRIALYEDAEIRTAIPYFASMKEVLLTAVPRPSTIAGPAYPELSSVYFTAAHKAMTGDAPTATALIDAELKISGLLRPK